MRFGRRFYNTTMYARNCSTVLLVFMCVYFCDFYSGAIPVPMVTYTRQELFACNKNEIVSGGKLPQPLFGTIKDNGICAVTRARRAGRSCNRQRTLRPVIGRRSGFKPTFHQRGVNNNKIITVKWLTCEIAPATALTATDQI